MNKKFKRDNRSTDKTYLVLGGLLGLVVLVAVFFIWRAFASGSKPIQESETVLESIVETQIESDTETKTEADTETETQEKPKPLSEDEDVNKLLVSLRYYEKANQYKELKHDENMQAVLDQFAHLPVNIYYYDYKSNSYAGLNQDQMIYAASVAKLPLVAYTQDRIERGLNSWTDEFTFVDEINTIPSAYDPDGTGTIMHEDYYNISYSLDELVKRVLIHSDNIGSNMLLYFMAYQNPEDFDDFISKLYSYGDYYLDMNVIQAYETMRFIVNQKETRALEYMKHTDFDGTKIDSLDVRTYQKIGASWPYVNNSIGLVADEEPYILSVISYHLEDGELSQLANTIYEAHKGN